MLAALPVLLVGACTTSASRTDEPSDGAGGSAVQQRQIELRDNTRQTDPDPSVPGDESPGRDLPTTLYLPSSAGPHPLVVFAHGFASVPEEYDELLDGWAEAGFVVAAPTFPLTSAGSAGVLTDIASQPADLAFVIASLTELAGPGGEFAGVIDPSEVAVAGHSAGAVSTIGLLTAPAGHPDLQGAVVLAGSTAIVGGDFTSPPVPTFFVHGDADDVVPIAQGREAYAEALDPKAGLTLLGATHVTPYRDPTDPAFAVVLATSTDFLRWTLQGDDEALTRLRGEADEDGVSELTGDEFPG